MDDNHVSDNDGNNEDDPEVADGVSLGPRLSNSQVSSLSSLPPSLRAESLPPSAQASQMPSIRGSERSEPSGTGVDAPGEVKADRIPLEQRRAGTGGSSSLGGMEALEGVYEGVETSEQEFKLEHRDHMKRKLDLQQRAMQDARREGRDRRRKEKQELLLAWRKEIREEARERMKHDRSLTYDEAVREARQGMQSGSESDSDA